MSHDNNRLLAAAPDLVRAIEGALDAFSWHENAGKFQPSGSNGLTVVQELRAALAKAGMQ